MPSCISPEETGASTALAGPAKTSPSVFHGRGVCERVCKILASAFFGFERRVSPPVASGAGSPEGLPQPLGTLERITLTAAGFDGG